MVELNHANYYSYKTTSRASRTILLIVINGPSALSLEISLVSIYYAISQPQDKAWYMNEQLLQLSWRSVTQPVKESQDT